jgi:oxaloacetate decarboxylase alpha subunit
VKYKVTIGDRSYEIEVDHDRLVRVDGRPLYVDLEQVGGLPVYSLTLDDTGYVLFVEEGQGNYQVEVQGRVFPVEVRLQRPPLARRHTPCARECGECLAVTAPLAGRLVSLPAAVGARVETGEVVAVVESMKMQMELKAPENGVVEAVYGPPGRNVSQGESLVSLQIA